MPKLRAHVLFTVEIDIDVPEDIFPRLVEDRERKYLKDYVLTAPAVVRAHQNFTTFKVGVVRDKRLLLVENIIEQKMH